jgi:hypothetical protein
MARKALSAEEAALPPSGPWVGYYLYEPRGAKHRQEMNLTFKGSAVTGDGSDDIGKFLIKGTYRPKGREARWWKTYPGSHEVYYRGFYDGKSIWGVWTIQSARGGFRIWPKGLKETEELEAAVGVEVEVVEAVGNEH